MMYEVEKRDYGKSGDNLQEETKQDAMKATYEDSSQLIPDQVTNRPQKEIKESSDVSPITETRSHDQKTTKEATVSDETSPADFANFSPSTNSHQINVRKLSLEEGSAARGNGGSGTMENFNDVAVPIYRVQSQVNCHTSQPMHVAVSEELLETNFSKEKMAPTTQRPASASFAAQQ